MLLFLLLSVAVGLKDGPFREPTSTRIWSSSSNVSSSWIFEPRVAHPRRLLSLGQGRFLLLTAERVLSGTKNSPILTELFSTGMMILSTNVCPGSGGALILVQNTAQVMHCSDTSCLSVGTAVGFEGTPTVISCVSSPPESILVLATTRRIYSGPLSNLTALSLPFHGPIIALALGPDASSWAASQQADGFGVLYQYSSKTKQLTWVFTPGLIDTTPVDLTFFGNVLWAADFVLHQSANGITVDRIGAHQGLPRSNLTSVSGSGEILWIGSAYGVMSLTNGTRWDYLTSGRFLPTSLLPGQPDVFKGAHVVSIAALDDSSAVVATDSGLAVISYKMWLSLEEKADFLQSQISVRHYQRSCGPNGGVTTAQSRLKSFGNLGSAYPFTTDNDGLYTSIYIISQAFRYQETNNKDAKNEGWKGVLALKFLHDVTGGTGLIARSVVQNEVPPGVGGTWHRSVDFPSIWWKGNVSSDEVTGHQAALAIAHTYLAETAEEKALCAFLIANLTRYICENGYRMKGFGGVFTRWGDWAPESLNYDPVVWEDDRGHNSLQILAWLLTAFNLTGDKYFLEQYNNLAVDNGYLNNILNTRISSPSDEVWFDLRLQFFPWLQYFALGLQEDRFYFSAAMQRSVSMISNVNNPWVVIAALDRAGSISNIAQQGMLSILQSWPTDGVLWPTKNLGRWDISQDPDAPPDWIRENLPYYQLSRGGWADSPMDLSVENTEFDNGMISPTPSGFLWAYWMGRFVGIIE